ncbi:phosphatase PAP2 family protein [Saccharomonospora saliphila]|uniref:phosphatase PAP2 family protein n=1 Tax=Saccharomonospora saliphila TaxID=369829 RepID=UPI000380CAAA|nr:phosphatase PAP2 family protein [Saccharomonospora saliphila]
MLTAGSVPDTTPTAAPRASGWSARPGWWAEILLGLGLFGFYLALGAVRLPGHRRRAEANGEAILAVEAATGTDVERALNTWLAARGWLTVVANYEYAVSYVAVTLLTLIWLYLRRPGAYRWARRSFVVVNLVAIVCFWLYPVTPPRLLPGAGFVDTVRLGGTWGSWGSPLVDGANQLAAMPSLHIAWAVWVSVVLARVRASVPVQVASAVHVVLTLLVIVATGNHYWLDAPGGVAVVWLGVLAADLLGRRRGAVTWTAPAGNSLRHPAGGAYTGAVTDTATETTEQSPSRPGKAQLAAARAFVAEHGDPARAVVERLGRAGARVVLVGQDGALGDVVVPSVETGEALIAAVEELTAAEWDADTVGATAIGAEHRRRMAGPRARR